MTGPRNGGLSLLIRVCLERLTYNVKDEGRLVQQFRSGPHLRTGWRNVGERLHFSMTD